MQSVLLVFFGAGMGGVMRHGVNLASLRAIGPHVPAATLIVNVAGSLLMGLLAGWLAYRADMGWGEPLRLLLATGFLGGFTTFSAFSLDVVLLFERGAIGLAAVYMAASVLLSVAALMAGLYLMRSL